MAHNCIFHVRSLGFSTKQGNAPYQERCPSKINLSKCVSCGCPGSLHHLAISANISIIISSYQPLPCAESPDSVAPSQSVVRGVFRLLSPSY